MYYNNWKLSRKGGAKTTPSCFSQTPILNEKFTDHRKSMNIDSIKMHTMTSVPLPNTMAQPTSWVSGPAHNCQPSTCTSGHCPQLHLGPHVHYPTDKGLDGLGLVGGQRSPAAGHARVRHVNRACDRSFTPKSRTSLTHERTTHSRLGTPTSQIIRLC